jgi:hypothetical protein
MKPKYKIGDKVTFVLENEKFSGEVYIVDANGTWDNPNEVSYDVLVDDENGSCLYKHIGEHLIENL